VGKGATLKQLLDRAAAEMRQRRDLDPRIEADQSWMIGVNYRAMGEFQRAVAFLERSVALRRELLGLDDEHTLAAQNSLAVAYHFAGQPNKAVPLGEETL